MAYSSINRLFAQVNNKIILKTMPVLASLEYSPQPKGMGAFYREF
jgi:hypothetical protein